MITSLDNKKDTHFFLALIHSADSNEEFIGIVSDHRLLAWFDSYAKETPSFKAYLSSPIQSLSLPSINLHAAIVSAPSTASVLDAMKLMSEEGVSSVAVVDENTGGLLSAVSVTDIGKVRKNLQYSLGKNVDLCP